VEITSNFIPYPKQYEIIQGIIEGQAKHNVLLAPRQHGKTILASNLLLYYAINYPDSYNVLISPIFAQSKKSFVDLAKATGGNNPLIKSTNASELIMTFWNGSTIRMLSAESGSNLRGITVSGLCVLDESAFIEESVWTEIIRPATMILGKKVLFISTPFGSNWFKKIYEWGEDKAYPEWASYRITPEDNPYLNKDDLETARLTVPSNTYLQEFLGMFIDGTGSVFEKYGECSILPGLASEPQEGRRYYAGLDLAIQEDFTVLIVFDDRGHLVDFFRQNRTSWEEIIDEVTYRIKKWNAHTLVEKNSIGSVVFEALSKKAPQLVEAFTTTQTSKQDLIEALKLAFTRHEIKMPNEDVLPDLHTELSVFTYKMLAGGKISYSAPSGLHDDCVVALALALKSLQNKKRKGVYNVMSKRSSAGFNPSIFR
jgi:phage FluMu gp28-like protein